jgi:hypothetical protein
MARIMGEGEVTFDNVERSTHTYVVGQSGTGKSRALESWIMQDALAGRGVGVIDPHGDLFGNLIARLSKLPDVRERVVIIDPLDPKWVVGLNPLEVQDGFTAERSALFLTDVVIKVWRLKTEDSPRMVWLLMNSFLALASLGLTILDLPKFLTNKTFREAQLVNVANDQVLQYFGNEFPSSERAAHQWTTPILNKLGHLLFDPNIRLMFRKHGTVNLRQIIDQEKVLLVNVPKGIIGEGMSSLIAAIIVAQLQQAALSRADSYNRPDFYLYLDEFQNYTTDNIQYILSEGRKYGLSLLLAHQYLDQVPSQLRSAILNTSGTVVSFRVGYEDASRLAKEIFPTSDFLERKHPRIRFRSTVPFSIRWPQTDQGNWGYLSQELANLANRQFWSRKRGAHVPVKQMSYWMPRPQEDRKLVQHLRDISGSRHGVPKPSPAAGRAEVASKDDLPMWAE